MNTVTKKSWTSLVINCSIFSTNKTVHVSGLFLDKVTSVKGLTLSPDISGIKFLFRNLQGKYIANDVLFYRPVVSWRSPCFTILLNLYFWSGSQMIAQFTEKLPVLSGHKVSQVAVCLTRFTLIALQSVAASHAKEILDQQVQNFLTHLWFCLQFWIIHADIYKLRYCKESYASSLAQYTW